MSHRSTIRKRVYAQVVAMAEPPKPFATRRHGESYGVGTWREGGDWREASIVFCSKSG